MKNGSSFIPFVRLTAFLICTTAAAAELHPIVEVGSGYFFGASDHGKWVKAERAKKSIEDGVKYRVYGLTKELGEAKGTKSAETEEVCPETLSVAFSPKPEKGVIALAATWNALLRKPRVADTSQQVYVDAVRDFLQGRGIKEPKVKIKSVIRVDLDGDGEDEVLISATNYFSQDDSVSANVAKGSYSAVILRRVVAGKVRTQLVAGEFYPKAKHFAAPNEYEVSAVLDLNGDGKLEVVVHSAYYEGGATTIYACERDKIIEVLSVACGV